MEESKKLMDIAAICRNYHEGYVKANQVITEIEQIATDRIPAFLFRDFVRGNETTNRVFSTITDDISVNKYGLERLNQKLAIWAGFKYRETGVTHWCENPEGKPCDPFFDFSDSLDLCFRWLVPELHVCCLSSYCAEGQLKMNVTIIHNTRVFEATAMSPALALCLAIEKLIDQKGVEK